MHDPAKSRQRKESDRLIPQSMIPAVRISVLASSSVIAPPFKTFSVHFKICSQLLSIFKSSGRMAGSCLYHTLRVIRNKTIRV